MATSEPPPKRGPVRLYNDVYFRTSDPEPCGTLEPWAPFPRLPPELRLHVWFLALRKYRLIEVHISATSSQDSSKLYTDRNHLGRVVSGRHYNLQMRGGSHVRTLSPLLWVNREAREATLAFYRVHLPLPRVKHYAAPMLYMPPPSMQRHEQHALPTPNQSHEHRFVIPPPPPRRNRSGNRVLYLSPEFDVLSVNPGRDSNVGITLLPDLLHDIKSYDPRGQG